MPTVASWKGFLLGKMSLCQDHWAGKITDTHFGTWSDRHTLNGSSWYNFKGLELEFITPASPTP